MPRCRHLAPHLLTALLVLSAGCTATSDDRAPLTSLRAVEQHHAARPSLEVPVRLAARVTYVDQGWGLYIVTDGSSAVQVQPASIESMMFEGSRLEILGHTSDGNGQPVVVFDRLLRARREAPDAARPVAPADMLAGRLDGQRVRMTGTVASAHVQHARLRLDLDAGGEQVVVWLRQGSLSDSTALVGQAVSVSGVPFRHSQAARDDRRSELLADSHPELVRAGTTTPAAPLVAPAPHVASRTFTTAAGLRRETERDALLGVPVRLRGVVTYFDPAWRLMFVQDDSAGIFVDLQGVDPGLRVGDEIDVEGVSSPGEFAPSVRYRHHVRHGRTMLPAPICS